MKLESSIVIAPLFLFTFFGIAGYFIAFGILSYLFCNHSYVTTFNFNIKSSSHENILDTSGINKNEVDKVLDEPNNTVDEIKNIYQHPHQNPEIDLKLACFIKPTKSPEMCKKSWLKFCDEGKILNKNLFPDLSKSEKSVVNPASVFQETFGSYLDVDETGKKYDYFLFAESETYIIVSNLLEYLKNEDSSRAKAYGHAIMSKENNFFKFGGTFLLNRKSMKILVEKQKDYLQNKSNDCVFGSYMPDSEQLLKCLIANGGHAIDSRDHASKSVFFPNLDPYIFLKPDFASTIQYQKTMSECQKKECLSPFPVAIHKLKSNEFELAHFLITWCRHALFLNDYKDPEVGINGLTFKGNVLLKMNN